jgi:hypothetical protein
MKVLQIIGGEGASTLIKTARSRTVAMSVLLMMRQRTSGMNGIVFARRRDVYELKKGPWSA